MKCPHCSQQAQPFYLCYLWPFAKVTCPYCGQISKLAKQPKLTLCSLLLGFTFIIPLYFLSGFWLWICILLIVFVDYQVDKRFRFLKKLK